MLPILKAIYIDSIQASIEIKNIHPNIPGVFPYKIIKTCISITIIIVDIDTNTAK